MQIRKQTENLPTYTEYYNSQRTLMRPSDFNESEYILQHDFKPFNQRIEYTIAAGAVATVTDKPEGTLVHFKTSLNYFDALHHEINELLVDLIRRPEIDPLRKNRVYWGLKYLAAAFRRIKDPSDISSEMVHPTEMVFDIFLKFKGVPNPPVDLLAQCFNVCTALVPMLQTEIFNRVINMDILPFCTSDKLTPEEYANGAGFDTGLVGYYLVSYEKVIGKYEFLTAYLTFLKEFTVSCDICLMSFSSNKSKIQINLYFFLFRIQKSQMDCTVSLELSGLIFLLREVFPYVQS